MKKIFLLLNILLCIAVVSNAQDSTQTNTTEEKPVVKPKYAKATFRSTRIINMQSTEMLTQGDLQLMISHHFGHLWNSDAGTDNLAQFFGLNSGIANTYIAIDYTAKSWANVGVSLAGKSYYEGWLKFKLLRQQTGVHDIPVSVAWYSLMNVNAAKNANDEGFGWNRFSFLHQLLIARKFNDKLSLELIPTLVHYNYVAYGINNDNNIFSLGMAGKYKLGTSKSVVVEYSRQLNMYQNVMDQNGNMTNYNPDLLSVGMEFSTGGHVFGFFIGTTTASSLFDQLTKNTSSLRKVEFALGFNLNRSFNLRK